METNTTNNNTMKTNNTTTTPLHYCINTNELKQIIQGQKNLQTNIQTFQNSLTHIFKLYEKHDTQIDKIREWKAGKHVTNGHTQEKMANMKETDKNLETKLETLKNEINTLQQDILIIKTAVLKEEQRTLQQDERQWSTRDKIITGTALLLISFILTFLYKTFIL